MHTPLEARRIRRNQIWMTVVFLAICAVIAALYEAMLGIAKTRQMQHKHSFYEYVVTHHIGELQDIDDGTGFDPASYVLILNRPVPDNVKEEYVLSLMKKYVQYDHGQTLTVLYQHGTSGPKRPIADVHYDDDHHVLTMTLTLQSGHTKRFIEHVDW